MKAYRIVDWQGRYEVTLKGREAEADTPLELLRKTALKYVRSKVYGHSKGTALEYMIEYGWRPGQLFAFAVFGIFHKLLEIAADQRREFRGWVLDKDQRPLGPAEFARMFKCTEPKLVQEAFDLLCRPEIRWLEVAEFTEKSGRIRENPGESGLLYKYKQTEENKHKGNFAVQLCNVLKAKAGGPLNPAVATDIINQVNERCGNDVLRLKMVESLLSTAKKARSVGDFVNRAKEPPFNYIPVRRNTIGRLAKKVFAGFGSGGPQR